MNINSCSKFEKIFLIQNKFPNSKKLANSMKVHDLKIIFMTSKNICEFLKITKHIKNSLNICEFKIFMF